MPGKIINKRAVVKYDVVVKYLSEKGPGKTVWNYEHITDIVYNDDNLIGMLLKKHYTMSPKKAAVSIKLKSLDLKYIKEVKYSYDKSKQGIVR